MSVLATDNDYHQENNNNEKSVKGNVCQKETKIRA